MDVEQILKNVDIDNSGRIDYNEFIAATINNEKLINEQKLKTSFDFFDHDKSGQITTEELKAILKLSSFEEAENIIAEVDANKDGEICFEEFKSMMKGIAEAT